MILIHNCLRCGHEWPSRLPNPPRACARCKSLYWNRPRQPQAAGLTPGAIFRIYHFHALEIGQDVLELWPDDVTHRPRITRAVNAYAMRTGKKFHKFPQPEGLLVRRIA